MNAVGSLPATEQKLKRLLIEANAGNAAAQFNLGVMLHGRPDAAGQEPGQNRVDAVGWLLRAANQGLPRAQLKLAEVYAGAPQARGDAVRACTWFRVAMSNSVGIHRHQAKAGYDRLAAELTSGQLSHAESQARVIQRTLLSATVETS